MLIRRKGENLANPAYLIQNPTEWSFRPKIAQNSCFLAKTPPVFDILLWIIALLASQPFSFLRFYEPDFF